MASLSALIHAWGQHIDHQLRHVWSGVGGQSQSSVGSIYALTLLPLAELGETALRYLAKPRGKWQARGQASGTT